MNRIVVKWNHCTPTEQGNELWANKIKTTSHPRGRLSHFYAYVYCYYLLLTLFCPLMIFTGLYSLILSVLPAGFKYFSLLFSLLSHDSVLRLPVPSLLAFCIFSSWLPSLGCVWRVCNSISCSWRSLRASTRAKSTTICVATASRHWWWASQQP